jgi:hypothetical protein
MTALRCPPTMLIDGALDPAGAERGDVDAGRSLWRPT